MIWPVLRIMDLALENMRSQLLRRPRVTQHNAGSTNSTQSVIQYTGSSIKYTPSVALPHLLRYPVSNVKTKGIALTRDQTHCNFVIKRIGISYTVTPTDFTCYYTGLFYTMSVVTRPSFC
jgi:hypothetical protein